MDNYDLGTIFILLFIFCLMFYMYRYGECSQNYNLDVNIKYCVFRGWLD